MIMKQPWMYEYNSQGVANTQVMVQQFSKYLNIAYLAAEHRI